MVHATLFFYNEFIEMNSVIEFQVLNMRNPPDTRESSPFTNVIMVDPTNYQLTQYLGRTTLQT